jgi:hypothetical protein
MGLTPHFHRSTFWVVRLRKSVGGLGTPITNGQPPPTDRRHTPGRTHHEQLRDRPEHRLRGRRQTGPVLGRRPRPTGEPQPTAEFAAIDANDSTQGPRLAFHQVPEAKTVRNRLHLDLISSEFASEADRLLSLGAIRVNDVEQRGALDHLP